MEAVAAVSSEADLLAIADRHYRDRQWSAALALYQGLLESNPALARNHGVPLAIIHCLIELPDPVDWMAMVQEALPSIPESARVDKINWMRIRVLELCRCTEYARAQRLLRFLASFDSFIDAVYRDGFRKGRSGCWEPSLESSASEPGFLRVNRWTDEAIAALKDRFRGRRLLLVVPWTTPFSPGDRYRRSAESFGLTVRMVDETKLVGNYNAVQIAEQLEQQIQDFQPDLILFNSFVEFGANIDAIEAETGRVLEAARRERGIRVVETFGDAWMVPVERISDGLGRSIDLVHHCHPLLLQHPALDDPRVFCYFHPVVVAPPTAEAGTIPFACSVGSVNFANVARLVWWVEAAMSDLPLRFIETEVIGVRMLSAEQYSNMLREPQVTVSLTRRLSGVHIATGRTFEVLAAGGVLVEENSVDARYFLQPGVHYLPFETFADLAELIPRLLDNADYRQGLARDGQSWVQRYFSGDWLWAGLLSRLYGPDRL